MAPTDAQSNPFTEHLNPPQLKAVTHVDGPLLVFAGAGSGKTRVITFRIANLIAVHKVPPYRILSVTFTNKAAGEMRHRLESLLGRDIAQDAWVGTFHATCAKLLRRYADGVGLSRDFVIYDDGDQRAVIARVLKELELDDRQFPPKVLLGRMMKEKQEGRGPGEGMHGSFRDEVFQRVFAGYQAHLTKCNAVDFEDLIGHVMRLAESPMLLAGQELRDRFDYVLVDEFQDTNHVQYRLVRALVQKHHNLCVVGDDDQSIYRWRGGDVRIIRNFKRDFPEAEVVKLEENYRSTANVVRAALAVIAPSEEREPKALFTRNVEGAKVQVVMARDEHDEGAFVVSRVKQAIASGDDPASMAVFYRIHAMSRVIEEAFRIENVPYRIVGGTRFFERAEIKDVLSYLRVLLNPRSDVDLLRIINVPTRGIGDSTINKLIEAATARQTSLYDALDAAIDSPQLATGPKKKLAVFRDLLASLRAASTTTLPSALAARVLAESGYEAVLRNDDTAEADARLENLKEFVGSIKEFEQEEEAAGSQPTLAHYLERVTLSTSADEQKGVPQVSLMTVHSSKGLEFDNVFILGLEEDLFPYSRQGDEGRTMDEEEERRLAYVAITRARKHLYLLNVAARTIFGNTRPGRPSRFIRDIPREVVQTVTTPGLQSGGAPSVGRGNNWNGGPSSSRGGWGGRQGGAPASPYSQRGPTPYSQRGAPSSQRAASPWQAGAPPGQPSPPAQAGAPHAQQGLPLGHAQQPGGAPASIARRPAPQAPARAPGERYVERDADAGPAPDVADLGEPVAATRGMRVKHARFGVGTVQAVSPGADPSASVYFPGWGEKKVLLRFLQPV
jgi:DNA helicase II / ATP-dependent DNA helicase PcrA